MLPFYHNIPFFCIFLCMIGGIIMPLHKNGRHALRMTEVICFVVCALFAALCLFLTHLGECFSYQMGHFPAPWGNELFVGPMDAMLCALFALVLGLSLLGGTNGMQSDILPQKQTFYCTMMCMTLASLLALTTTNDLFTGYVFMEISTLAACAIVMARDTGPMIAATIRYLILSLLGSGLFLIALAMLYCITGHLLMPQLLQHVLRLHESGVYHVPLTVICGLMALGLGIKSSMFPFYAWLPPAHGGATTGASAVLSGLVLKGYLVFLIRIFYRVFSLPVVHSLHVTDVLLVFGIAGMLAGSVMALREGHSKRMLAYSSVAQIGYIFMGLGLGTDAGVMAAVFQILAHAVTKPLLFLCVGRLSELRHHEKRFDRLRGAAHEDKLAGIGFTVGALSMVGIPLLTGFTAKLFFADASMGGRGRMWAVLLALALSSVLNACYYIPALLALWAKPEGRKPGASLPSSRGFTAAAAVLTACVVLLGTASIPLVRIIQWELSML